MSDARAKRRGYGLIVRNSLQFSKRISRVFAFNERIIAKSLTDSEKKIHMGGKSAFRTSGRLFNNC